MKMRFSPNAHSIPCVISCIAEFLGGMIREICVHVTTGLKN